MRRYVALQEFLTFINDQLRYFISGRHGIAFFLVQIIKYLLVHAERIIQNVSCFRSSASSLGLP